MRRRNQKTKIETESATRRSNQRIVRASGQRLDELTDKINRGERLTNQERLERQGIIFNHSGKCGKIIL